MELKVIATIHNGYHEKFGVPRQSGLVESVLSEIQFEPEYRDPSMVRGIESFGRLWLIWGFSDNPVGQWSPTVRPPRLGGNKRIGVFATRSSFRPNSLGLSCVRLRAIDTAKPSLYVAGADLVDGTPIYDIKPYLPYADCFPFSEAGYADSADEASLPLDVRCPEDLENLIPEYDRKAIREILSRDPRPRYHDDPERIYGLSYSSVNVKFKVDIPDRSVTVVDVEPSSYGDSVKIVDEYGNQY